MREIKFRAYLNDYKMVVSVEYINLKHNEIVADIEGEQYEFQLGEYELMQYTGLKDKNGKEIYEGDIYHQGDKKITYTVVWHDTGLIGKQNGSTSYAGLSHWQDRIEIIGNIYENPELLEEKQ